MGQPGYGGIPKPLILAVLLTLTSATNDVTHAEIEKQFHLESFHSDSKASRQTRNVVKGVCALTCAAWKECAGFRCDNPREGPDGAVCGWCGLLAASALSSGVQDYPGLGPEQIYLAYTNGISRTPSGSVTHMVDVPGGLKEGMIFVFEGITENEIYLSIALDENWYGAAPKFECVFFVSVFMSQSRFVVDNFDGGVQVWAGPYVTFPGHEFMTLGHDTRWVLFLGDSTFTLTIGGKFVSQYPRNTRYRLQDFRYVEFSSLFSTVRWFDPGSEGGQP